MLNKSIILIQFEFVDIGFIVRDTYWKTEKGLIPFDWVFMFSGLLTELFTIILLLTICYSF